MAKTNKAKFAANISLDRDVYDYLAGRFPAVKNRRKFALSNAINVVLRERMVDDYQMLRELRAFLESKDLHLDMFAKGLAKNLGEFLDTRKK